METSILQHLQDNSVRHSSKLCLHYENAECNYRELWHKIKHAVALLQSSGVNHTHRVYLSGANSIDLLVLFFALIALDADAALIDSKSSKDEIESMLQTLPADFLLLEEKIFSTPFRAEKRIVCFDIPYLFFSGNSYRKNKAAFVTFFSTGTTGDPKAFGFTQQKLVEQVLNLAAHLGLNRRDKVLCPVSFTHSHGVMMTLPFLFLGASVYYMHTSNCKPTRLIDAIRQN
jgi:long-chain acyl-CoA synthetase